MTCYPFDWEAISALATLSAVLVALWIPMRERHLRKQEKLREEAKAATIVSLSLSGILEIMPNVIENIKKMDGLIYSLAGKNVLYGLDECQELIEKELYVQQLPLDVVAEGQLTVSLARRWVNEINTKIQLQNTPELIVERGEWKNHEFTYSLGKTLYDSAVELRSYCKKVQQRYDETQVNLFIRVLRLIKN